MAGSIHPGSWRLDTVGTLGTACRPAPGFSRQPVLEGLLKHFLKVCIPPRSTFPVCGFVVDETMRGPMPLWGPRGGSERRPAPPDRLQAALGPSWSRERSRTLEQCLLLGCAGEPVLRGGPRARLRYSQVPDPLIMHPLPPQEAFLKPKPGFSPTQVN